MHIIPKQAVYATNSTYSQNLQFSNKVILIMLIQVILLVFHNF